MGLVESRISKYNKFKQLYIFHSNSDKFSLCVASGNKCGTYSYLLCFCCLKVCFGFRGMLWFSLVLVGFCGFVLLFVLGGVDC